MTIQTPEELEGMRRAGMAVAEALRAMREAALPGVTTLELDVLGEETLHRCGARSAPRLVYQFPGCNCISVNDEAVHGIPGGRVIEAGDLVKLDVTADLEGYVADAAITVAVPPASSLATNLVAAAERAFWRAAEVARAGRPISVIGRAIETEVRQAGFHVLRELHSHGVGRTIHEEPRAIPNYYEPRAGQRLRSHQVITIEPIIAVGTDWVRSGADDWTILTEDRSLSAHYEHTVMIRPGEPLILTAA